MSAGWKILRRAPAVLALVSFVAGADEMVAVDILGYKYVPAEVTIHVGDTVKWTNRAKRTSHSALCPAANGLEAERLIPDESWERRFTKAGRYDYTCTPHPEMKGVVIVGE